jgi:D-proline reductase (dithiol) PrdB
MPYSFSALLAETGKSIAKPVFDRPVLTPLRKPIAESTIGLFVSCGAQLPADPPLLETEDITFRLLHRDTPVSDLIVSHKTLVRKWALEDLNVAYPIDRLKELEAEGVFKRLAHTNVSMVGSIERYTELVENTIPSIKAVFDSQGVDLVMVLPFCPACHRATGIIARALEARGLPTIGTSVLWEMSEAVKPPRTCFLDFPLGCPAGKPFEAEQQRAILRRVFELAPSFETAPEWAMQTLPFQWSPDGDRSWEETTSNLYRNGGLAITSAHMAAHAAVGESLVGKERAFAVKCNC